MCHPINLEFTKLFKHRPSPKYGFIFYLLRYLHLGYPKFPLNYIKLVLDRGSFSVYPLNSRGLVHPLIPGSSESRQMILQIPCEKMNHPWIFCRSFFKENRWLKPQEKKIQNCKTVYPRGKHWIHLFSISKDWRRRCLEHWAPSDGPSGPWGRRKETVRNAGAKAWQ